MWLGSNYPDKGEYNQENDLDAVRYVLSVDVPFEIATVRYGKGTGTDAVRVTRDEIGKRMPGKGPRAASPVTGMVQKLVVVELRKLTRNLPSALTLTLA